MEANKQNNKAIQQRDFFYQSFHNKQPLFVLSSQRSKNIFYNNFSKNISFYRNILQSYPDFLHLCECQDTRSLNMDLQERYFKIFKNPDFNTATQNSHENINSFLPQAFTISEFFSQMTYSLYILVPQKFRSFFMSQALKIVKENDKNKFYDKQNFLHKNLESEDSQKMYSHKSFLSFLETSNILLDFYDELREHKIPITKEKLWDFCKYDTYDDYSLQLEILAEIYGQYQEILQANNLCDAIYSNTIAKNYEISTHLIESFCAIHIDLEGFISFLDYEKIEAVAQITPLFLHFTTDSYNLTNFKFLQKKLEPHKQYIYCVHSKKLLSQEIPKIHLSSIQLYKTSKVFNQANLALAKAYQWQKEILQGANENDFAIILPNENFYSHLLTLDTIFKNNKDGNLTLDSKKFFNFAMGISIDSLKEYSLLENLYKKFIQQQVFNVEEIIQYMQKHIHLDSISQAKKNTTRDSNQNFNLLNNIGITQTNLVQHINNYFGTLAHLFEQDSCEITPLNLETYGLDILEKLLHLLFCFDKNILVYGIDILSNLKFLTQKQFLYTQSLNFQNLFMLFMRDFSQLSVDDVGGGKIRVMGTLEARNLLFKEVLILDFTDDFIPNISYNDIFLNSNIRSIFLMPTRQDKENLYKHHYYNILRNTETTHICFVVNDEKIPSNMLLELHCDIEDALNIDDIYVYYDYSKIFEQHTNQITPEEFPKFDCSGNNKISFSATSFNVYQYCTRRFYYQYIENLQEEIKNTIPLNIGNIIHAMLYESYKDFVQTNEFLKKEDIDCVEQRFNTLFQTISTSFLKKIKWTSEQEIPIHADLFSREKNLILNMQTYIDLDNMVNVNMPIYFACEKMRVTDNRIKILGLEYNINIAVENLGFDTHDNLKRKKCKGFIDRIDIVNDEIIIYDYKTGSKPNKEDLQMPFYALCSQHLDILQDYKTYNKQYIYILLKELKDIALSNDIINHDNISQNMHKVFAMKKEDEIQNGQEKIHEIFTTFGQANIMTDDIRKCDSCPYTILCGRE
ncbi:PD-(D/E)XK nuclease family protein [Helicobacter didelphidarum]|uniref:PD-(D/E)XK nuclease family protein n=1 Tax=Helicobacter didelphidarum TaxID=2040648 RepID=A0A3D8ILU2_9HELI|nr:PD-(D/E)XK nuclease family protein [Helicobacter didelphidarum]RDU65896.1 PD-(D/E)XK nuclease family protein [Helicobacter didelphidarum]